MNILYIILANKDTELNLDTITSVKKNLIGKDTEITIFWDDNDINQPYYKLLDLLNKKQTKDCDYVCLIPNNSTLTENYREIIEEYFNKERQGVYLPLGIIISNESKHGLFNTILWSNQCIEPGVLDHDLALRQTDTVLFGALIPKELFFDESYYLKDLKFYQHYHLLNHWSKLDSTTIYGIPKLLINLDFDLTFKTADKEDKINNYKLANQEFKLQNA